jgi:serine/threonine-protein kinase
VAANIANSPTVSVCGTQAGLLLGTAAYMAPEQARGQPVDRRADIWAFGCVVYEMLTGRQAFPGATLTDVLAAIVMREPDWERLPSDLPPRFGSLLRRCLRKDPRERLRDIGDARLEIEEIQQAPHGAIAAAVKAPASLSARLKPAVAGVVVGAVVVGAVLSLRPGRPSQQTSPARLHVELPAKNTLSPGRGSALALSPDGATLVFVASAGGPPQLFARALDRFESTPLPGTEGATNPFFCPMANGSDFSPVAG